MPRKPRVEYAGALYHVMSRGDNGRAIYDDDGDRAVFLKTLGEICARMGWKIYAYVLMGNHYHLLMETPEANLVAGMKWFLSTYTLRYNARHRQHGHVFQGRYKTTMIEPSERGFLERVSRYIHLNPLRAKIIKWPEERLRDYRWSSFWAYIGREKSPEWLETSAVLDCVGIDARRRGCGSDYEEYIEKYCSEAGTERGRQAMAEEWRAIHRGWCMGDSDFREKMLDLIGKKLKGKKRETYSGEEKYSHDERAASKMLAEGLKALGLGTAQLPVLKKSDKRKQVLAWWLSSNTSLGTDWISDHLALGHRTAVSKARFLIEQSDDSETRRLRKKLDQIPNISD